MDIYNAVSNVTYSLSFFDTYDYSIVSVKWMNCFVLIDRDEGIVPHIIDWHEVSDGIFGIGTTKWKTSMVSVIDALQVQSFGLYLDYTTPRVDINKFSS